MAYDASHRTPLHDMTTASKWYFGRMATGLAAVAITIVLAQRFGYDTRLTTTAISTSGGMENLTNLWYDGLDLVAVERKEWVLVVSRWRGDSAQKPERMIVDLRRAAPVDTPRIRPGLRFPGATRPSGPRRPDGQVIASFTAYRTVLASSVARGITPVDDPAPAVSRDGRRVAWLLGRAPRRLSIGLVGRPSGALDTAVVAIVDTGAVLAGPDSRLAFSASGSVVIYDARGGTVEVRSPEKGWLRTKVGTARALRVVGNQIVLTPLYGRGPPARDEVLVIDAADPRLTVHRYAIQLESATASVSQTNPRDLPVRYVLDLPVAMSEAGHISIGTPSGEIVHLTGGPPAADGVDSVMTAPGAVRALAFLDDHRILAAGDFRGIHLLAPGRQDQEIVGAPIGTTLLAVHGESIAYGSTSSVSAARLVTSRTPSDLGVGLAVSVVFLAMGTVLVARRPRPAPAWPVHGAEGTDTLLRSESPVFEPAPPPPAPDELVSALQRGDCILVAGTGVGAQAALPVWPAFLAGLADYAREQGLLGDGSHAAVRTAIVNGNLIAAAEELALEVPVRGFRDFVDQTFSKASPSDLHKALGRLPFAGAVTTNFDTLLDKAFAGRNPVGATTVEGDVQSETNVLRVVRERRFFILNMLGRVDRPATLVFTPRPYRDVLQRDMALRQLMRSLFERYCVFFIGMGLPAIRDFLEAIEASAAQGGPKHFALVGQSTPIDTAELRTLEKNYGIKILGFIPAPGWPEPQRFLEDVAKRVGKPKEAPQRDRPRLSRLVLKNIGPFEKLDIPIQDTWNVILGDNGVGKSIILRSIAAALSGQEAPVDAVRRLLRSGKKDGEIEVFVGESASPHTMQLYTDIDGLVQLKSPTFSPLRLGNWLVIGFPALRAMTYAAPPELRPPPVPSALDLTTLMTNEVDARLTDLKAWLIDLRTQSKSTSGAGGQRAGRLFERFFEVLAAVTPDAEITFHDIDPQKRILIKVNGELVPMEAVSQGTASVLCWVGVMLQRMYEVHVALDNPEHGSVLVLVDEVDAHMHPSWQQAIAPALRRTFPQLQVLATTHSPLIVGTMAPKEILVVQRIEGHPVVEHSTIDPRGMRADQLLTSGLFLLKGTRDPETSDMLMRYTDLATVPEEKLSPKDKEDLAMLSETLRVRLPGPAEREEARKAFELIEGALDDRMARMPEDRKEQLRQEIKKQLQGLKSRTPGSS